MNLTFQLPLLAVENIERSKAFYCGLFGQKVVLDFGKNVTFSGGFAIQEDFSWLTGLNPSSVRQKSNNMELYFEVDDFDCFLDRLADSAVEYVHPPMKHDWQQRVVRIYDPDGHMVEIGESMTVVAQSLLSSGKSVEETARITQYPKEFVESALASMGK